MSDSDHEHDWVPSRLKKGTEWYFVTHIVCLECGKEREIE